MEKIMDDNIITIGDSNGFDGWKWKMTIDLKELVDSAGIRKKEKDGIYTDPRTGETEVYKGSWYTDYPMTKAKKLLNLISRYYIQEEDLLKVDKWMAKNPKLALYWGTIR